MSEFDEIERDEIAVQFVRVPDGLEHIRRAWDELEAVVPLRGPSLLRRLRPGRRRLPRVRRGAEGDELAPGLEAGRCPAAGFSAPGCAASRRVSTSGSGRPSTSSSRERKPDESRPSLEHYRRRDEIDLLLPI